jgi:hypothetical protein
LKRPEQEETQSKSIFGVPLLFEFGGGIAVFFLPAARTSRLNSERPSRVIVKHGKALNGFQPNENGHMQFSFSGR